MNNQDQLDKKKGYKVLLVIAAVIIVFALFNTKPARDTITPPVKTERTTSLETSNPTPTNKTKQFEDNYVSAWDGSCRPVVKAVKERMNDPESFDHAETVYAYDTKGNFMTVAMKFRGANAYGGKVLTYVTAKVSMDGEVLSLSDF